MELFAEAHQAKASRRIHVNLLAIHIFKKEFTLQAPPRKRRPIKTKEPHPINRIRLFTLYFNLIFTL